MTRREIVIRPVTRADMEKFYGTHPRTVRAVAVELDGEVVCIAGVAIEKGRIEAFSDLREGVDVPKITVYRYAHQIMRWIMDLQLPVMVTQNPERSNSHRFLVSMGFTPVGVENDITIYRLNPWVS